MANTYKDIVITPNKGSSTDDPKIVFSGGNTSVNTDITLRVYPDSNGTLSFEGSAGQLFSVTNDLTGSLFTVNDVSGIPSIEVDALGNVDLAPFGGNVGIGTSNPVFKLDVQGDARITGNLTLGDATTDTITVNAANFNLANNVSFDSGTLFIDKNNDRIGIGTTSPSAKLDVKASDGTGLYIGTSSVNYYDANVHVLRSTLQLERMRIDSGGNVGIGTSNPTAKLTINGGGITGPGTGLFVANGDITTSRSGGTTGAIYFGSDSATKFLYHDGTAYYFGSTGNVITPQGYQAAIYYDTNSNYYMDLDGGSKINNLQILGAVSATTNTAFYYDAALEVRELNLAGAQADIANCAPRIGMHWGGRVASQIVLESSGRIAIRDNPGNSYEAFAAGSTYIAGALGVGTSPTGTPLTVSRANQGTITTFNGPTSSMVYQDYGSLSYFWNNNSDLYFGTYTANTLYISTNSSARITVTSTGNVGIGTTSTSARLQVVGTSSSANVLYLNVGGNYLRANGFGSGNINLVGFENNVLIGNEFSGGALALIAGGSERVRVTSSGSVGIGTSPSHALHVNGNAMVSGSVYNNDIRDTGGNAKLNWVAGAGSGINAYGPIHTDGTYTFLSPTFSSAPRGSIVLGDGMGSDVLAFNPPSTAELYNGNTWSSTTVTDSIKALFQGKHSSSFSTYEITTANAGVRFTWTSTDIPLYIFLNALLITSLTQGNSVVATLETSTDSGSTWTTVTTTNAFNTWPGYTIHNLVTNLNASSNRMRISFVRSGASNGNSIWLGQIGLINSYQAGNRLFNWNVNRWLGVGTISNGIVTPTAPLDVAGAIVARSGAITTAVASTSIIDNNAGIARFISRGPDASTNGTFQLISTRSDGSSVGNRVIIDASGNMGLGATPNVPLNITNFQVGTKLSLNFGSTTGALTYNSYWDGAFKYMTSDFALDYRMNSGIGAHTWHTAPSGTAGTSVSYTERMRLDANGNVAIGQASAPERLVVFSDTDNSAEIGRAHVGFVGYSDYAGFSHVDQNSGTNYALLQQATGQTYLNSASGQPIYFRHGNGDQMILSGGNLGIGTTSPTGKLDVWGAGSGRFIQTNPNDLGYALSTFNASAGNVEQFNIKHNLSAVELRNERGQLNLVTNTASSIVFYTANTAERMRIDSAGNVGIGTSSPNTKFVVSDNAVVPTTTQTGRVAHFVGSDTATARILIDSIASAVNISTRRANGTAASPSALLTGETLLNMGSFGYGATGYTAGARASITSTTAENWTDSAQGTYWTFSTTAIGSTTLTERMRIDSAGNLGIGNTSPGHKLSVNGTAHFTGKITSGVTAGTDGIDFVSSDAYANMRVIRNAGGGTSDGMYIGYGNAGSATTKIYGGGATTGALEKFSTYTLEPGSFRSPIFYDSDNTAYYVDPGSNSKLYGYLTLNHVAGSTNLEDNTGLIINNNYTDGRYSHRFRKWDDGGGVPLYVQKTSGTAGTWTSIAKFGSYTSDASEFAVYGYGYATASWRAPIFYDSDNTNYYLKPSGLTNIDRMRINSANTGVVLSVGDSGLDNASTYGMVNLTRAADTVRAHLAFIRTGNYVWQTGYLSGTNSLGFFPWNFSGSQGTPALYMDTSSIVYAPTEFRTPIIYDSNDTATYLNPSGTSVLGSVIMSNMRPVTDGWHTTNDSRNRFYFASNGRTFFGSQNGYEFRSSTDTNIGSIDNSGNMIIAGNIRVNAIVENSNTITSNYTITAGYNAMTAGPISINSGVTVTVPSGSTWTIV